jgi:hypothetical protein
MEISDLIVHVDPETLARLPVRRGDVVDRLEVAGDRRGARLVRQLPVRSGDVLDEGAVDQLLVRVHAQIQRLSVEFLQGGGLSGCSSR